MRWATIWKVCGKKDLKYVGQIKDKIEDFIDKNLKKIKMDSVERMFLAQDVIQRPASANMLMNCRIPK